MKIKIATANIAGAARQLQVSSNRHQIIANTLSDIDIIGFQEVVKIFDRNNQNYIYNDISELKNNTNLAPYKHFYFSHLDSLQQSHPDKWTSQIFSQYYNKGNQILQGSAIFVRDNHSISDLWRDDRDELVSGLGEIIPWYAYKPVIYQGNRDTEPRSVLIMRVKLRKDNEEKYVLFCCMQLTTIKGERDNDSFAIKQASKIRTHQINWIVQYIQSYQNVFKEEPTIMVGDFNTEPDSAELNGLKQLGLKIASIFGVTHRKHKICIDHIYVSKNINPVVANIIDSNNTSDHNFVMAELDL